MVTIIRFPQLNMHMLFHLLCEIEDVSQRLNAIKEDSFDVDRFLDALQQLKRCSHKLKYALQASEQAGERGE